MKYKSIICIYDNTIKAKNSYKLISKQINLIDFEQISQADLIIVLGGDGFMLHVLHNYLHLNLPFYGINCGTVGFLMNELDNNLIDKLTQAKCNYIHPLKVQITTKDQKNYQLTAINELYLFRQSNQAAKLKILVDDVTQIAEMTADGVIVATSVGSSAYNFSAGGNIIPIGANILALTPINPFRPRRWRGALLPKSVTIYFEVIDSNKRAVTAVADFNQITDAKFIEVKEDKNKLVRLLFNPGHSLEERILKEQFL